MLRYKLINFFKTTTNKWLTHSLTHFSLYVKYGVIGVWMSQPHFVPKS